MLKVFPLLMAISPVLISQLLQLGLIGLAAAGVTVLSVFLIKRAIRKHREKVHGTQTSLAEQLISTQDLTREVEHTDTKLASLKLTCFNDEKKKLKTENTASVGSRSKESVQKFKEGVASAMASLTPDKMMYGVTMEIKGTNRDGKAKSPVVVKFPEMSTNRDAKLALIKAVGQLCMDTAATTSEVRAGKGYITKDIIDNILAWTERANSNEVLDASRIDLTKSPAQVLTADNDLVVNNVEIRQENNSEVAQQTPVYADDQNDTDSQEETNGGLPAYPFGSQRGYAAQVFAADALDPEHLDNKGDTPQSTEENNDTPTGPDVLDDDVDSLH